MPIWRSALCFVFGVALIVSAVRSPAVILSGDRAVFILVAWVVIGAYLIVRPTRRVFGSPKSMSPISNVEHRSP